MRLPEAKANVSLSHFVVGGTVFSQMFDWTACELGKHALARKLDLPETWVPE